MLAEFGRIQAGEIYDRTSGETRVNLYITLVSFTGASIVAFRQLTNTQDPSSVHAFYFIATGASLFISLLGTITFRLLLERWHLTIIYLRKLARIRRWFATHDQSLHGNLAYTTDETFPSFESEKFLSVSLITLVSIINSVSIAASAMFLLATIYPSIYLLALAILGVVTTIAAWLTHHAFALRILSEFEKDKNVAFAFPVDKNP